MPSADAKRIAKNTIFLYFRQLLTMVVNLYAMRIVLAQLGTEDYGIYNVIAGVVILFSFLSSAMISATQRYLNYTLGQKNEMETQGVFNASVVLHVLLMVLVLVLTETIGIWIVTHKLNISGTRTAAAFWCYQFSIFAILGSIFRIPFDAAIIAYEQMNFFAFLSIFEALLKLLIVFLLSAVTFDKLIAYSAFMTCVAWFVTAVYVCFCKIKYPVTHFSKTSVRKHIRNLLSFSAWVVIGSVSGVCKSQGITMIVNIFCGVIVNAALGIARQINTVIGQFVSNFETAYKPQVVKSYASEEFDSFRQLTVQSMKVSFMLLSFVAVPFAVNAVEVLGLWLTDVPQHTVTFVRLMLLDSYVFTLVGPLSSAITATGKIEIYNIGVTLFNLAILPLAYVCMRLGTEPEIILAIQCCISFVSLIWRFFYLQDKTGISPWQLIRNPLLTSALIIAVTYAATYGTYSFAGTVHPLLAFLSSCAVSVLVHIPLCYFVLLTSRERKAMREIIKNKLFGRHKQCSN